MRVSFVICDPLAFSKQIGKWVIKEVDGAPGSHFAIRLDSYTGINYYEAVLPCSRKLKSDEWNKHYKIIKQFDFEVPSGMEYDVLTWLESMVGRPYSIAQLVLIAVSTMSMHLQLLFKGAILNHEKALICTEYGSRFVERFMNFHLQKSHDNIGVEDMYEISEALTHVKNLWKE
jgi:hypothetical protein